MLNRRIRRKVFWQRSPLAAGRRNVEDRIHDHAQSDLTGTAMPACWRHQRFDQLPLRISQVACITQFVALMLFAGGFSPTHVVISFESSQTRKNHNGLESLNFLFSVSLSG